HVRSSFSDLPGTIVTDQKEGNMEAPIISGVAHDGSQGKVTVKGVPDLPGVAARIFEAVAARGCNIDMIVQNVSAIETGLTDVSFTLPEDHAQAARSALADIKDDLGFADLVYNENVGKLSLVGAGMRSHPGVSAKLFGALRDAGVNIEMISTSEIRI